MHQKRKRSNNTLVLALKSMESFHFKLKQKIEFPLYAIPLEQDTLKHACIRIPREKKKRVAYQIMNQAAKVIPDTVDALTSNAKETDVS
ncbi:hypothetical protein V6N13_097030 [Hibiscus sabdariffa]|uniref:Uncharacterized protein n=1 Tax=Hibiscus sabdariffa TaxID=183260 RepID=A0ABR1ZKC9_9ROSI